MCALHMRKRFSERESGEGQSTQFEADDAESASLNGAVGSYTANAATPITFPLSLWSKTSTMVEGDFWAA